MPRHPLFPDSDSEGDRAALRRCDSHQRPAISVDEYSGRLICRLDANLFAHAPAEDVARFRFVPVTAESLRQFAPERICAVQTCDNEPGQGRPHCAEHAGLPDPRIRDVVVDPAIPDAPARETAVWRGAVSVAYGQFSVDDLDVGHRMAHPYQGGIGLVTVVPGQALFVTGTHTGTVDLTVVVADGDPGADTAAYEDVVETGFTVRGYRLAVVGWSGSSYDELRPLPSGPGSYRMRYHARGMDAARSGREMDAGEEAYLLQIWPAEPSAAVIRRSGSEYARYWQSAG